MEWELVLSWKWTSLLWKLHHISKSCLELCHDPSTSLLTSSLSELIVSQKLFALAKCWLHQWCIRRESDKRGAQLRIAGDNFQSRKTQGHLVCITVVNLHIVLKVFVEESLLRNVKVNSSDAKLHHEWFKCQVDILKKLPNDTSPDCMKLTSPETSAEQRMSWSKQIWISGLQVILWPIRSHLDGTMTVAYDWSGLVDLLHVFSAYNGQILQWSTTEFLHSEDQHQRQEYTPYRATHFNEFDPNLPENLKVTVKANPMMIIIISHNLSKMQGIESACSLDYGKDFHRCECYNEYKNTLHARTAHDDESL